MRVRGSVWSQRVRLASRVLCFCSLVFQILGVANPAAGQEVGTLLSVNSESAGRDDISDNDRTVAPVAIAQHRGGESESRWRHFNEADYYWNFLLNPVRFVTAPLKWDAKDWLFAGLATAGVVGLAFLDEPLRDFWQDSVRGSASDGIADVGDALGGSKTLWAGVGAGLGIGLIARDSKLQVASLEAFQSLLITAAFTEGLKNLVHRHRPEASPDDAFQFDGPSLSGDNKSFPSGHAAHSFAVASSFASAYPDDPLVAPIAYGAAGLVAWSRVNDDKHWLTDVVVGAVLGYSIGKLVYVTSPFRNKDQKLSLRPYSGNGATGVEIAVRF